MWLLITDFYLWMNSIAAGKGGLQLHKYGECTTKYVMKYFLHINTWIYKCTFPIKSQVMNT